MSDEPHQENARLRGYLREITMHPEDAHMLAEQALAGIFPAKVEALREAEKALRTLFDFGRKLMQSDDENERGIGCCIVESARIVEDR